MRNNDKLFQQALKNFIKQCSSFKSGEEMLQNLTTFLVTLNEYISKLDIPNGVISDDLNKLLLEFSESLYSIIKQTNGDFLDKQFLLYWKITISQLLKFTIKKELYWKLCQITFWCLTYNTSKFTPVDTKACISFFLDEKTLNIDENSNMLALVNNCLSEIPYESKVFWWKIFCNTILPLYLDFDIKAASLAKVQTQKVLPKRILSVSCYFIHSISNEKPDIRMFDISDFNSCIAVSLFIPHIIYTDSEKYKVLISSIANNLFPGELSEESISERNSFSFSRSLFYIPEQYTNQLLQILPKLFSLSRDFVSQLIVLLLRDICTNYPDFDKIAIPLLRCRSLLDLIYQMNLNDQYFIIISSLFFFIATGSKCSIQLFRIYFEFTMLYKLTSVECWKYVSDSVSLHPDIKSVVDKFITQFVVASAGIIFGTKIINFNIPNIDMKNPLLLENEITNSPVSVLPYFTKMDFIWWPYETFKSYMKGILNVFPISENLHVISVIFTILLSLSKLVPYNDTSNFSDFCEFLLYSVPIELIDEKFIETAIILLAKVKNPDQKYVSHITDVFIPLVSANDFTIDILSDLTQSNSPEIGQIIIKSVDILISKKIKIDSMKKINILISSIAISQEIAEKVLEYCIHNYSKAFSVGFIRIGTIYALSSKTPEKAYKLITKPINGRMSSEVLCLFSILAKNEKSIFSDEALKRQLIQNIYEQKDNIQKFSLSLLTFQDLSVFSNQISDFSNSFIKNPSQDIHSLIELTEYSIIDAFDHQNNGNFIEIDKIESDQDNFLIRKNNLYGEVDINIKPIKPELFDQKIENDSWNSTEKHEKNTLEHQNSVDNALKSAINTIPDQKKYNPSDFHFNDVELPKIELETNQEMTQIKKIGDEALNSYYSMLKAFSEKRDLTGKKAFDNYEVDIIIPQIISLAFKDFLNKLGEKGPNSIIYTEYRYKITYHLCNTPSQCKSSTVLMLCSDKIQGFISSKQIFLWEQGNLIGLSCANDNYGIFSGNMLFTPETLAKLLPWCIAYNDESTTKSKRYEILNKFVCK
ncbi:hypothetical protein TVAG_457000 [Trichomonas vaginalis G3]|uniref:Uncharacterized protein n=1 Tax=Trichomonas vaginalis (strain ATCC PRA-98 / G3) TaxID=412133 RepID=A2DC24_TRIV3|nr:hypothetical protein TVAGG3_0263640 [Trichomonas vaginalis G3]EAY22065.1 hypothetical protein TVAG_457000 [Trichomonas vaginalis G3]KAI5525306.1 hypothetical protein TVAGG3_0263640 [Trichomonas vaginalis G3]|eukprot:XP_001583051.1 hypothetical protein [Trichomonas vaginalis G3]